jgi:hypothetical protein
MHIYIIVMLLLYNDAVSGGSEKVLILAEFIADIYRQFPNGCIFIIHSEAQQQGKEKICSIYSFFVFVLNRNVLTEAWDVKYLCFAIYSKEPSFETRNDSG